MPKWFSVAALFGSVFNCAKSGSAFLSAMRFRSSSEGMGCVLGVPGAAEGAEAASTAGAGEPATGAEPRKRYPTATPTTRQTADITMTCTGRQSWLWGAGALDSVVPFDIAFNSSGECAGQTEDVGCT